MTFKGRLYNCLIIIIFLCRLEDDGGSVCESQTGPGDTLGVPEDSLGIPLPVNSDSSGGSDSEGDRSDDNDDDDEDEEEHGFN